MMGTSKCVTLELAYSRTQSPENPRNSACLEQGRGVALGGGNGDSSMASVQLSGFA